ncbi:MAG: DMT family transporter [Alphaproteobacteria bacterium]
MTKSPAPSELPAPEPATDALPAETRVSETTALVLLMIVPVTFCSNMLIARMMHGEIPPVAMAFWRWTIAVAILLPFTGKALWRQRAALRTEWRDLLALGALGMGFCGAFVYIGAETTTATNIGLIYAGSPVIIILIGHFVYRETMSRGQTWGVAICLLGVVAIICKGDLGVLLSLSFTPGDLWIVAASIGWGFYAVILKYRRTGLDMGARFLAIAIAGIAILLPFTVWEGVAVKPPAVDWRTIGVFLFLALIPGIASYQIYALIQRTLGANRTSLVLYMIPFYNSILAWLLLDEAMRAYHYVGGALVLAGIYFGTRAVKKS